MSPRYQFATVTHLAASAQGAPGNRTFCLEVGQGERWVRTWLEKAVLQALAEAIDQTLAKLAGKTFMPQPSAKAPRQGEPRQGAPTGEFRVGRMAMGYHETTGHLVLILHEEDTPEDGPPTLECGATQEQMRALSGQIRAIVAAGRPPCPLCGGAVDPTGHVCPGHNGHHTTTGPDKLE